jgi:serine/threonine protein kinase
MSIAIGERIGPYEVVSRLGAGGMGEVYKAIDSRLQRTVAIKVLPELFSLDEERLARFDREARTLAALNHPNIAQIYGLEESPSEGRQRRALSMEFVEGEDLAGRLSRGAMPLEEALTVARQIVDALEAAHERGIIHRDLKPANIMVRTDGQSLLAWGGRPVQVAMQIMRLQRGKAREVLHTEPGSVSSARVSPDGRWLAYDSTATGTVEVYVLALSGQRTRIPVTAKGGDSARWSPGWPRAAVPAGSRHHLRSRPDDRHEHRLRR